jgi:hypothetical protein
MARDGALTLSDLPGKRLHIVCEPCGRRGRYAVATLIAKHGDAKLPDLLTALADCPKTRAASIHDRCKVRFDEGDIMSRRPAPRDEG